MTWIKQSSIPKEWLADADAWEAATRPSSNRNPVASSHNGGNARQNLTRVGRAGVKNDERLEAGSVARRELSLLRMYRATPMALGRGNWRQRYEASWIANNWNKREKIGTVTKNTPFELREHLRLSTRTLKIEKKSNSNKHSKRVLPSEFSFGHSQFEVQKQNGREKYNEQCKWKVLLNTSSWVEVALNSHNWMVTIEDFVQRLQRSLWVNKPVSPVVVGWRAHKWSPNRCALKECPLLWLEEAPLDNPVHWTTVQSS